MSPAPFLAQLALLLALGLVVLLAVAGYRPRGVRARLAELLEPVAGGQRNAASGLGWSLPAWLGVRLGAVALEMDRALLRFVADLVALVAGGGWTLDRALADLARNPDPRLARALGPLRAAASVGDALVDVARRDPSPMLERVCVDLLLSIDQTPEAFVEQSRRILIPRYERDLEVRARGHAVLAGGRQTGLAVLAATALAFVAVARVDGLRAAYAGGVGQALLVGEGVVVTCVLAALGTLAPRPPRVRWDVAAVREQVRRT